MEINTFFEYLKEFLLRDRATIHLSLPFWFTISLAKERSGAGMNVQESEEDLVEILFCFPPVERSRYFGLRRKALRSPKVQQTVVKEQQGAPYTLPIAPASKQESPSNRLV